MNKKGFTYIEMVCVLIVITVIVSVLIHLIHPKFLYAKESSFINEANNIVKAAINKYTADTNDVEDLYPGDIYHHKKNNDEYFGKVCYNIKSLEGKYLKKLSDSLQGSVEICTLSSCKNKTKIWLSNDKFYLAGAEGNVSKNDLTKHVLGINRCGVTY